jgi:hypothetical protein
LKILRANGSQKRTRVIILISDKIHLQSKVVTRDKEGTYIMGRCSVHLEDIIAHTYTSSIRAPEHVKQILTELKRETATGYQ